MIAQGRTHTNTHRHSLAVPVAAVATVAGLLLLASPAAADIPAHCVRPQVLGEWTFKAVPKAAPVLGNSPTLQMQPSTDGRTSFETTVTLSNPDRAVDEQGNQGFWTLVYDQGIEVDVAGRKWFMFFDYTTKGQQVQSHCGRSLANGAWYHDVPAVGQDPKNWGEFSAQHANADGAALNTEHTVKPALHTTEIGAQQYVGENRMIEHINSAQSSWTASVNNDFVQRTMKQLQLMAGARSTIKKGIPAVPRLANSMPATVTQPAGFPPSWDWTNVSGVSFVEPIRDQGNCGSCYSFGSTSSLDERVRIMTGDADQAFLSPQDVVSCNPYSQGCDGGFPYLVYKFAEDFGLASELCFPYESGIMSNVSCNLRCKDESKYIRTTGYEYVGGFYGACSEQAMMQEIYHHGPVAVSFEVYPDLLTYTEGIYHHVESSDELAINPWEITNHVVVIVGWGESDNGEKYWRVKNSWGHHFGMQGYFNIRRGTDECGIESMAVGVTPVLQNFV